MFKKEEGDNSTDTPYDIHQIRRTTCVIHRYYAERSKKILTQHILNNRQPWIVDLSER